MIKIFSSIRSTYRAVSVAIDSGDISNDMRRSLELVRTCHQDLQLLIKLRHENLHILEDQPQSLERLNTVIEKVHSGMVDAYRIVEKYRPELHTGKTSLQNQIAWASHDSREFQTLGPIMSQHHAAVLAEITFLRSLRIITTTQNDIKKVEESSRSDSKSIFDNMGLLEDLMGDISGSLGLPPTSPPTTKVSARASMPNLLSNQEYCDLPEPVIPNIIPHQQPISSSHSNAQASSVWMTSAETSLEGGQRSQRVVLNQSDHSGLSLLFDDELDLSFNLPFRIQSQLSHTSSSDLIHRASLPPSSFSSVNGESLASSPPVQYSLTSRPSTLSLSSRESFSYQMSETQHNTISDVNRPHLLSLPPTPPTKTAPFISPSISSVVSEISQNAHPKQRLISFAERYENMNDSIKTENQQYHPWRPMRNNDVYELQGSNIAHEPYTEDVDVVAPPNILVDIWKGVQADTPSFSLESDGRIVFDASQGFRVRVDLIEIGAGYIEQIYIAEPYFEASIASKTDLLRLRATTTTIDRGSGGDVEDFRWLLEKLARECEILPQLDQKEVEYMLRVGTRMGELDCLVLAAVMGANNGEAALRLLGLR
ncbi:hypothetical protein ACHAQJ_007613 [Trichoderma viride]